MASLFTGKAGGSHCIDRAVIAGEVRLITVSAHRPGEDIKPGTLDAMIRQSGLPKKLFR
jgi:predicted RNA binding protein YcfA (HicA-like mRNA interferase family)